ncbi:MAG: AAA family ATPase [Planctomycetes bacterium]|nr:AAA family ATPase [Planctomycetota bacterium]
MRGSDGKRGRRAGLQSVRGGNGRAGKGGSGELLPAQLRWDCPPLKPSGRQPTAAFLLGQDRPMSALRTGLAIHAPGYHLFVSGLIGSGRTTVVEYLLRDIQPVCRRGPDRVLVHDFRDPVRPALVSLPPGKAAAFRDELQDFGRILQVALQSALRSRPHRMSRRVVMRASEARERRIMDALQRQASRQGCQLVRFQAQNGATSADIYPVVDGEAITLDALSTLVIEGKVTETRRDQLLAARDQLIERLEEVSLRVQAERRRMDGELRDMERRLAWKVLQAHGKEFRTRWPQHEVADWLDAAGEHIERHLRQFVAVDDEVEDGQGKDDGKEAAAAGEPPTEPLRLFEFGAQILKTSTSDACPVAIETNPTFTNLFGTIAPPREGQPAGPTQVSPGAILRADGGYLILRCIDVLREPGVWPHLKRTLQNGKLEIREIDQATGALAGSLQPEAIPIDVKVVLIGEPGVYEHLAGEDIQFPQIFKIHAEFDSTIAVSRQNLARYADYLQWLCSDETLRSCTPDAVAAIAEYGARAAGRRDRLITRYSELGDLAREASHLAQSAGESRIRRVHVEAAMQKQRYRHDLSQELVERDYASGYMRLSTSGLARGQINALTVLDTGALEFGRPCRITCNSGAADTARSGLINIEGLVNLSGPIHDKGVMILEGYLLQEYGDDGPLCMQATICFEQLYNGVEGDSASLAQLLALLSSLADVPLDQGLAITGSVNQKGEVQAVSGVNEKIEGFFRLCRARKLTGRQGVVLPRANVHDLMLDREVVEAVSKGQFHVYAAARVEDALERFTGRPAVEVLLAVRAKLTRYREIARRTARG